MTGVWGLASLWIAVITQTGFVCSDMRFIERHEGESVVLPCVADERKPSPFGVYLRRRWLDPRKVLFKHTGSEFVLGNNADKNRTSVSGDPNLHSLNVTISQLRAADTDRYYCEFVVGNDASEDQFIEGKTEFLLLVTAGDQCGCSSYSSLLYALSSAVAVLLLLLLLAGCVLIYKGKARRGVKSHPQAPIYEEMTGMQPLSRKAASHRLEEMESSEYRNCPVTKSCPENYYERPTGGLCPKK
uniref:Ig-like domain-containing protein n=1 Tax=Amphiprion percula TaxID=161767 RepID=A0A3P8RLJ0_AMPPE